MVRSINGNRPTGGSTIVGHDPITATTQDEQEYDLGVKVDNSTIVVNTQTGELNAITAASELHTVYPLDYPGNTPNTPLLSLRVGTGLYLNTSTNNLDISPDDFIDHVTLDKIPNDVPIGGGRITVYPRLLCDLTTCGAPLPIRYGTGWLPGRISVWPAALIDTTDPTNSPACLVSNNAVLPAEQQRLRVDTNAIAAILGPSGNGYAIEVEPNDNSADSRLVLGVKGSRLIAPSLTWDADQRRMAVAVDGKSILIDTTTTNGNLMVNVDNKTIALDVSTGQLMTKVLYGTGLTLTVTPDGATPPITTHPLIEVDFNSVASKSSLSLLQQQADATDTALAATDATVASNTTTLTAHSVLLAGLGTGGATIEAQLAGKQDLNANLTNLSASPPTLDVAGGTFTITDASSVGDKDMISTLIPSMQVGRVAANNVGQALSAYNATTSVFRNVGGAGSVNNLAEFGLYQRPHLTIDGNGNVVVPGIITTTSPATGSGPIAVFLAPSLPTAAFTQSFMGRAATTNDCVEILFSNVGGAGSNSNLASFGLCGSAGTRFTTTGNGDYTLPDGNMLAPLHMVVDGSSSNTLAGFFQPSLATSGLVDMFLGTANSDNNRVVFTFVNTGGTDSPTNRLLLGLNGTQNMALDGLGTLTVPAALAVGNSTTTNPAVVDIVGGSTNVGAGGQPAISYQYQTGGYRHFVKTRHWGTSVADPGNAIEWYLNSSFAPTGSSAPGTGNLLSLTLDARALTVPRDLIVQGNPQSAHVPAAANDLTNKAYVDGVVASGVTTAGATYQPLNPNLTNLSASPPTLDLASGTLTISDASSIGDKDMISTLIPGTQTGRVVAANVGQAQSTYNAATFLFRNVGGAGSANNLAEFGLYQRPHLTVDGNGNVIVPGTITATNAGTGSAQVASIFRPSLLTGNFTQVQTGVGGTANDSTEILFINAGGTGSNANSATFGLSGSPGTRFTTSGSGNYTLPTGNMLTPLLQSVGGSTSSLLASFLQPALATSGFVYTLLGKAAGDNNNAVFAFFNTGGTNSTNNRLVVGLNTTQRIVLDGLGTFTAPAALAVGNNTTTNAAVVDILGGSSSTGAGGQPAVAYQFAGGGGFRHFVKTRHLGATTADAGNAIEWYLNNSNTAGGSSVPGTGNLLGLTVDATAVKVPRDLIVSGNPQSAHVPVAGNDLTNKTYVDSVVATGGGSYQPHSANLDNLSLSPPLLDITSGAFTCSVNFSAFTANRIVAQFFEPSAAIHNPAAVTLLLGSTSATNDCLSLSYVVNAFTLPLSYAQLSLNGGTGIQVNGNNDTTATGNLTVAGNAVIAGNETVSGTLTTNGMISQSLAGSTTGESAQLFQPALASGNVLGLELGVSNTTNNATHLQFNNLGGTGSASNYAELALVGNAGVRVFGTGDVTVPGALTVTGRASAAFPVTSTDLATKGYVDATIRPAPIQFIWPMPQIDYLNGAATFPTFTTTGGGTLLITITANFYINASGSNTTNVFVMNGTNQASGILQNGVAQRMHYNWDAVGASGQVQNTSRVIMSQNTGPGAGTYGVALLISAFGSGDAGYNSDDYAIVRIERF